MELINRKTTFSFIESLLPTFALLLSCTLLLFTSQAQAQLPDFTKLVEEHNSAVVNVSTKRITTNTPSQFEGVPDELLQFFFGIIPKSPKSPKSNRPRKQTYSLGSGFIIDETGYIITNYHVVKGADEIYVRLRDRREKVAKLVGYDKRTDIALLKIEASGLNAVKIGSSKQLKVGEWVLAIGEPFGLDYTATKGIVSAKNRSLPSDPYVSFIQTDVPINPGNSGGPLFNMQGEVVGINAQIYSKSGGYMGLSFAIPIETALYVVKQLKANGKVTRGILGIEIQEVDYSLAKSFGMKKPRGALVTQVFDGMPAQLSQIKTGDIIISFDGQSIDKSSDLLPIVGATLINKAVEIEIIRQGKVKFLTATITHKKQLAVSNGNGSIAKLDIEVKQLTSQQMQQYNLKYGVMITKIITPHPHNQGLRVGDIIVNLNFKKIHTAKQLNGYIKNMASNTNIPMRIVRGNSSYFVSILIP